MRHFTWHFGILYLYTFLACKTEWNCFLSSELFNLLYTIAIAIFVGSRYSKLSVETSKGGSTAHLTVVSSQILTGVFKTGGTEPICEQLTNNSFWVSLISPMGADQTSDVFPFNSHKTHPNGLFNPYRKPSSAYRQFCRFFSAPSKPLPGPSFFSSIFLFFSSKLSTVCNLLVRWGLFCVLFLPLHRLFFGWHFVMVQRETCQNMFLFTLDNRCD